MKFLASLFCIAGLVYAQDSNDTLMKAMKDEVERSKTLQISSLDKPYFIEYTVEDVTRLSVSAPTGRHSFAQFVIIEFPGPGSASAITRSIKQLRFQRTGRGSAELTLDPNYAVLRRNFWLVTDSAFKNAVEAITRKRAASEEHHAARSPAGFLEAAPVQKILPISVQISLDAWTTRVRTYRAVFTRIRKCFLPWSTSKPPTRRSTGEFRRPGHTDPGSWSAPSNPRDRPGQGRHDGAGFAAIMPVLDEKAIPSEAEFRKSVERVVRTSRPCRQRPLAKRIPVRCFLKAWPVPRLWRRFWARIWRSTRRPIAEPGRPAPFRQASSRAGSAPGYCPNSWT